MAARQARTAAARDEAKSASGSASIFAFKAIATTLAGGLLTLGIAIAQIAYSNHLELLRRQGEQGAAFQARLFELTGRIENELADIVLELRDRGTTPEQTARSHEAAMRRLTQTLDPLYRQWRTERLLLRNQGSQIFGGEVAVLIYDRGDALFHADGCDVVRRDFGPADADCKQAMRRELRQLGQFVSGLAHSETLNLFRTSERSPTSFNANAEIAYTLVQHSLECTSPGTAAMPAKPRCMHLPEMLAIARRRAALVRVARENLADSIRTASALRE